MTENFIVPTGAAYPRTFKSARMALLYTAGGCDVVPSACFLRIWVMARQASFQRPISARAWEQTAREHQRCQAKNLR